MYAVQHVKLESVRRKSGGRVHLTPRVPRSGPVTTLCGQTLDPGTYAGVDGNADCANCIRRSKDPSRISGAFFAQEEGSELLRLSLEQARAHKPEGKPNLHVLPGTHHETHHDTHHDTHHHEPVEWPAPKAPAEAIPDELGELTTRGFKPSGNGVWRSPKGVVVRMHKRGQDWKFAELVYEGSIVTTRTEHGMKVKAGDVEVTPTRDGYEVRIKKNA